MYWFDFRKFFSCFLFIGGFIGVLFSAIAALESNNLYMLLWIIPAVVCVSAGFAILD